MNLETLNTELAPIYKGSGTIAHFQDQATGLRRYFVWRKGERFVMHDNETGAEHSIDVEGSSFSRLVAHVIGFMNA